MTKSLANICSLQYVALQAYIKIYQGEELPHPKSMLQVLYIGIHIYFDLFLQTLFH